MAAETTRCPFDHATPEYARDWVNIIGAVRDEPGLTHTDAHGGFFVAARYEDVTAIARDQDNWSQRRGVDEDGNPTLGAHIPTLPFGLVPIETDPPLQSRIRRALNPAFTVKIAQGWKPVMRAVADTMIDAVIETGRADLVRDITKPIPAVINFRLLGVPLEDWEAAIEAPGVLTYAVPGTPEFERASAIMKAQRQNVIDAVSRRRASPGADLLTVISQLELDGRRIDDDLVVSLVSALVAGGNGTTTALMSNALRWLGNHPEERQRLIDEPELMRPAVEEFLRFFTPAQAHARHATEPIEIAGTVVPVGERVLMSWAGANRDPEVFPEPDRVILDRPRNRHLSFGIGSHHCIGFNLARIMAATAIEAVLERMPDYVVHEDGVVAMEQIPLINGLRELPATFTPGPRIGASIPSEDADPQLPQSVLDDIAAAAASGDDEPA